MFMQTQTGRIQNLLLLQNVRTVKNEDGTFSVGYIQRNGEIIREGVYDAEDAAEIATQEVISNLLS